MEFDARIESQRGVPARLAAGLRPQVAEQVDHRRRHQQVRRAQRQSAQGPHLLLELARDGRLDRQVSRVVRARGNLVDQEPAVGGQEELDGQDADGPQRLGRGQGQARAPPGRRSGPTGAGMSVASRMCRSWRLRATG